MPTFTWIHIHTYIHTYILILCCAISGKVRLHRKTIQKYIRDLDVVLGVALHPRKHALGYMCLLYPYYLLECVCVYVCIYVCVYVCVYVCMCVCMCVCMYVYLTVAS